MSDSPMAHDAAAPVTRGSERPAVTVLVPIYNVERYLPRCLDSLLEQTFGDFEAICINDGSTDGSRDVIQSYLDRDERFRVVDKPNSGYGASMNRGLDEARGEYVAILESDDFFGPDALRLLHDAAVANGSDVVKANFWLYWSEPQERTEPFDVVSASQAGRTLCPVRDDLTLFFRKPSIWSGLYRRDFLEREGIRFLETPGAAYQDSGFNFKVWASARIATLLGERILFYRQDNEQSSVNSSAKVSCVCDEYAEMTSFARALGPELSGRLLAVLERMKLDSYLWNYDRLAEPLRPGFARSAGEELARDLDSGCVDLSLFEPGAREDLLTWARDPESFCELRRVLERGGRGASVRRYLKMGGPALLLRVVASRLRHDSVRKTDERGAAL